MDNETFWKLIDKSRKAVEDTDEQVGKLLGLVRKLDVQEILGFHRCFQDRVTEAYRWDLWAVAYIVNGGCSDDGFEYFLGWLVARGRKHFEAALKDPERAADGVEPGEPVECEDMWGIAFRAYDDITGKDDFFEIVPPVTRTIQGTPWDDDDAYKLYPDLARRFL